MREMVVKCDFCGKKIDMSNWENRCNNLTICHSQSSQNALEKFQKGNFQEVVIDTKDI